MIPHARLNKGYRYIMTVIDCSSKFAYAILVKNKTGGEVAKALETVLRKARMKHLQTDNGKECYNSVVRTLLNKYGVNHRTKQQRMLLWSTKLSYSTYSDTKASIVERFNCTLKNMMYRAFTEQGSYKWYPTLLRDLVARYNNTSHRTIGMRPREVNADNEELVLQRSWKTTNARRKRINL